MLLFYGRLCLMNLTFYLIIVYDDSLEYEVYKYHLEFMSALTDY